MELTEDGKVSVVLSAQDGKNHKNTIVNSAILSTEQFEEITNSVKQKYMKK